MRRRGVARRAGAALAALLLAAGPGIGLPAVAQAAKQDHKASSRKHSASSTSATSSLSTTTNALGGALTNPGATTPATQTATVAPSTQTSTSGSGISSGSAIGIALAAALIIVGIGFAIMRDARRRTRNRHLPVASGERVPGSKRPPKARKLSAAERKRRKRGRAPRRR
ncbi:MAG TPA: hypothetical protein VGL69_17110 [Solirubrobacteraceae bacterium]